MKTILEFINNKNILPVEPINDRLSIDDINAIVKIVNKNANIRDAWRAIDTYSKFKYGPSKNKPMNNQLKNNILYGVVDRIKGTKFIIFEKVFNVYFLQYIDEPIEIKQLSTIVANAVVDAAIEKIPYEVIHEITTKLKK